MKVSNMVRNILTTTLKGNDDIQKVIFEIYGITEEEFSTSFQDRKAKDQTD